MESSDFSRVALLFKALSDPNRLKIVLCLASSPQKHLTVSEIVKTLEMSQPLTSHHLKELRYAGIVNSFRNGPFVHYRLVSEEILEIIRQILSFLKEMEEKKSKDSTSLSRSLNLLEGDKTYG